MKALGRFFHFWYDFVVGDDWRLAFAGGSALGLCGLLSHLGIAAWWTIPVVVVATLTVVFARATPPEPERETPPV